MYRKTDVKLKPNKHYKLYNSNEFYLGYIVKVKRHNSISWSFVSKSTLPDLYDSSTKKKLIDIISKYELAKQ